MSRCGFVCHWIDTHLHQPLLQVRVPVIFYLVVGAPWQMGCNRRPSGRITQTTITFKLPSADLATTTSHYNFVSDIERLTNSTCSRTPPLHPYLASHHSFCNYIAYVRLRHRKVDILEVFLVTTTTFFTFNSPPKMLPTAPHSVFITDIKKMNGLYVFLDTATTFFTVNVTPRILQHCITPSSPT